MVRITVLEDTRLDLLLLSYYRQQDAAAFRAVVWANPTIDLDIASGTEIELPDIVPIKLSDHRPIGSSDGT